MKIKPGISNTELERLAVAAEYLELQDEPEKWSLELLEQKRQKMLQLIDKFRAFSDESRLDIFLFLMHRGTDEGELASFTVSEIGERFNISLSTVSHHLQELKRVGLLKMERRGKERYYQVDIDNIIEQVGILYQRLLKKRELIRQGIQVCPQEYLVEYFNRRLSKETVNDKD